LRQSSWWRRRAPLVLAGAGLAVSASAAEAAIDRLQIIAPASPGGGWDLTARAMRDVLEGRGIVGSVEIVHSPGAGGAIGLAQFLSARRGDSAALLLGGRVMINAIRANNAAVSLHDATPLARLTGEHQVVAVPASSPHRAMEDLVLVLQSDPGAISWAGGSTGGTDQRLVGSIARDVGVDPSRVNYVPFSGGGDAASALLRNQVAAGVSDYAEFEPHIRAGRLRALALSAAWRLPGVPVPTLVELGIDVTSLNWRGVFAPPGIDEAERATLMGAIETMARDPAWHAHLGRNHWSDLYLAGEPFARFVQEEEERARRGDAAAVAVPARWKPSLAALLRRYRKRVAAVALALAALATAGALATRKVRAAREREIVLSHDLEAAREDARRRSEEARHLLEGLGQEIDRQFKAWGLTSAEREVAHLMLKGLRHKEIAGVRNTSERTVRQQALAIYKKAGLEGRTDLAAFFLEDLLGPGERRRTA
jgi:putative tricarboxylic transport membrane protein